MTILITRPEPAASATASRLRRAGFEVVISPVLEIADTGIARPEGGHDALIITSANALYVLKQRRELEGLTDLPVFAVGDATAKKARTLGFGEVVSASGDARNLASLIIARQNMPEAAQGRLLYVHGVDSSPGLSDTLNNHGVNITGWPLYKAHLVDRLTQSAIKILQSGAPVAIALYSTRSARRFASLADQYINRQNIDNITFFVISPKVAKALPGAWKNRCFSAPEPNEDSLIALMRMQLTK